MEELKFWLRYTVFLTIALTVGVAWWMAAIWLTS